MEPKEEALNLVWYFYHRLEHTLNDEYDKHGWIISKMCAMKVVDELTKATASKYHYNIKHEIQKL
jgi:hypothetical protein